MPVHQLTISTTGKGLLEITDLVQTLMQRCGIDEGLCTIMIRHTSASLTIQENADPSARCDPETWLERLVPEGDALYTHTVEGPDDMPAHIKSALTASSLSIPMEGGVPVLGTWQGIFLWEHRHHRGDREVIINVMGDSTG